MEQISSRPAHNDAAVPEEILNEAATWLMELHEGPLSPGRRVLLAQWRQRSPLHESTWAKATILLDKFSAVPPSGATALKKISMPERRKAIKVLATLLVTGPTAWAIYHMAPWLQPAGRYRTAVGERRDVILNDHTQLTLNTDTEIDVVFNNEERLLLLRRGEVMITTAKDPATAPRPFLVAVAEGRIRALGTRFIVRQLDQRSQIAVFDGAVEISPGKTPRNKLILPAGEQTGFTATSIDPPTPCDDSRSAWTNGVLIANQMPLPQFIAELSRYRRGTLQYDASVARLLLSGVFPITDTDLTLSLLEQTMPVRLQYFTRYWVRVLPL